MARSSRCATLLTPKTTLLGKKVAEGVGELHFVQVVCAAQPLSIQVHPSKKAGGSRFCKRKCRRTPLTAAERNYKGSRPQARAGFALTPFLR
ncbi:type I phosphomannose isomerase catalytic subunit [Shigella flexneri]